MTKSTFSIGLHELEDGPKELSRTLPHSWVVDALAETDIQPHGNEEGSIDLILTKTGDEVLVQGHLSLNVSLPCSRTLDPAIYELRPDVFLMLSPAGGHDPTASRARRPVRAARAARKNLENLENPENEKKKPAKKKTGWETDPVLSDAEAATDTYSGDLIVLDPFIREFILLEVPMVPLREDLRGVPFEANPPLPSDRDSADASSEEMTSAKSAEKPLDPRFSPLAELKARLENKE